MYAKYSLADYILSIRPDDAQLSSFGTITVGGEGNALDSIEFSYSNDMWSTTSYSTGAWVHDKNLSRVGSINISLSQLSDQVAAFKQLVNKFYGGNYQGLTLSLTDSLGNNIATAIDCYFTRIPSQSFGSNSANQTWSLTAGKITID